MEPVRLKLENEGGKTLRTIVLNGPEGIVVHRKDTKRIEVLSNLDELTKKKISFKEIGRISRENLEHLDFEVPGVGAIRATAPGAIQKDIELEQDDEKKWWVLLALTLFLVGGFVMFLLNRTIQTEKIEAELKQEVVKIVKHIPVTPKVNTANMQSSNNQQTTKTTKSLSVKRVGALAALGSLSSGKQKGGLNLGAAQTTAGPGLGGTAGSGGVQTTLYGKGLVAAPLGAGGNIQGAGGYGTKGKGGGQAGYGTMSLVGSAGANPIPLGKEAVVGGGLDRDLIADVINRNLGQVRFCYEQGLQGNPSLNGRVSVAFTIGGNGIVKTANVENTTLNAKMVEDCILMRLKTWKFPLPEGGVDVKVSYPFVLRRAGQG